MLSRSCLPFAFACYKRCLVRRYSEDVIDLVRGSLHRLGLSGILGSLLGLLLISFYDPQALLIHFIFVKARCHLANLELVLVLLHVLFESEKFRDDRRVLKINLTAQMALGRGRWHITWWLICVGIYLDYLPFYLVLGIVFMNWLWWAYNAVWNIRVAKSLQLSLILWAWV